VLKADRYPAAAEVASLSAEQIGAPAAVAIHDGPEHDTLHFALRNTAAISGQSIDARRGMDWQRRNFLPLLGKIDISKRHAVGALMRQN
jgi:hypothetical protein